MTSVYTWCLREEVLDGKECFDLITDEILTLNMSCVRSGRQMMTVCQDTHDGRDDDSRASVKFQGERDGSYIHRPDDGGGGIFFQVVIRIRKMNIGDNEHLGGLLLNVLQTLSQWIYGA